VAGEREIPLQAGFQKSGTKNVKAAGHPAQKQAGYKRRTQNVDRGHERFSCLTPQKKQLIAELPLGATEEVR
jgi:hypothetical protein